MATGRSRVLSWQGVVTALPDFAFAGAFALAWVAPLRFGDRTVHRLVFVMLLEFIVMHSTAFLGALMATPAPRPRKAALFAGLLAFYALFAAGFALSAGEAWPLTAFLTLTLAKFPSVVLFAPDRPARESVQAQWAAMAILYLLGAFLTLLLPVPRLGVTPEVVALQQFQGSGLWIEQPHRVMAFGTLYFAGLGCFELYSDALTRRLGRRRSA